MKRKLLRLFKIIIPILVITLIGFITYNFISKADQRNTVKVSKTFIYDILSGKNDQAYELGSTALKAKQSASQFSAVMGNLKSENPVYKEASLTQDGKIYYYVQYVDGLPKSAKGRTDGKFTLVLVKEAGKWKVDTVNIK